MHRRPAAVKAEERSPTPPPRVVSVGDAPAALPLQMQKQVQKQSWQINNVQNELTKHAKTSASYTKATEAPKLSQNLTKEARGAKIGQSSDAKVGCIFSQATTQPMNSFSYWRGVESGRLSP